MAISDEGGAAWGKCGAHATRALSELLPSNNSRVGAKPGSSPQGEGWAIGPSQDVTADEGPRHEIQPKDGERDSGATHATQSGGRIGRLVERRTCNRPLVCSRQPPRQFPRS